MQPSDAVTPKRVSLEQIVTMPDPILKDSFDLVRISGTEDVVRAIGPLGPKHNAVLALVKASWIERPSHAKINTAMGIDSPQHSLKLTFVDGALDQTQLDCRAALSNELSELVLRLFKIDGSVARYVVFKDLEPETVKTQFNATSVTVAERVLTYSFKSVKEYAEYPSET